MELPTRREAGAILMGMTGALPLPSRATASPVPTGVSGYKHIMVAARPEPISIDLSRTAVLVIDMQNDFGAKGGMFDRAGIDIGGIRAVVPQVQSALLASRTASLPVFYVKMAFKADLSDAGPITAPNLLKHAPLHVGAEIESPDGGHSRILIRDTWNTEILPELRPQPHDTVIYKSRFSGFYRTELDSLLKQRGIECLIVTGCTTSVCVESTVRDAMYRDYRCIVLEDCTAEPIGAAAPRSNHQASLLTMQILFAWISDSQKLASALSEA